LNGATEAGVCARAGALHMTRHAQVKRAHNPKELIPVLVMVAGLSVER
jgi:hypothetical protein